MLQFLKYYILGGLEDQTGIFFRNWWFHNYQKFGGEKYFSEYYAYPYGTNISRPMISNQPLFSLFYEWPATTFNTIIYTNVYNVIQIILTLIVTYFFFKSFHFDKFISFSLSLVFVLSPFTYYNFGIHPALLTIWPLLLFLVVTRTLKDNLRNNFLSGVVLSSAFLFNNYFGYFGLIYFTVFTCVKIFFEKPHAFSLLKKYFFTLLGFLSFTAIFLVPYFFYGPREGDSISTSRALEDFFYFTSRPWYYFLPSPENPFFGKFTENSISFLQKSWGYWLTSNYFPSEHTLSYLGIINLILALVGIIFLLKKKIIGHTFSEYKNFLLVGLILISFTLPPYITISMHKLYTPSYLLYLIFPMFRSLVRLNLLVLLIQLIFTGLGLIYLKNQIKNYPKVAYIFICALILISLAEFYVPIKISKLQVVPEIYVYIEKNLPSNSVLVVYPYNSSLEALFWMKDYEKPLINPRDYQNSTFVSEQFTQELKTEEGLLKAKELGATHLIFFRYAGEKDRIQEQTFFDNSDKLNLVVRFENGSIYEFNLNRD